MTFPRLSAGLRCIIGTDAKGPSYRLVVPARFTFEAWVCRDERSGLVAVIPERILNPAPVSPTPKKKRLRPRFKLPSFDDAPLKKAESVKPESVKPESVKPESVKPESTKPELLRTESLKTGSTQSASVAERPPVTSAYRIGSTPTRFGGYTLHPLLTS